MVVPCCWNNTSAMRAYGHHVRKLLSSASCLGSSPSGFVRTNVVLYHSSDESDESNEEALPHEWFAKMLPDITKLTRVLRDVDLVDGRLEDINNADLIVTDESIRRKMHTFKSLARVFIGSPLVQQKLKEKHFKFPFFRNASEREPVVVNSLTKVSDVLNISAQQRKVVRFTVCPQVTQFRIWTGALEEILSSLKEEVDLLNHRCPTKGTKLGLQVISSCLKFLSQSAVSYEDDSSTSWMRPVPVNSAEANASPKWGDVLEMFDDLIRYLEGEKSRLCHLAKVVVMKEGLFQIKDVFVDNSIGYREVRHQESLVQKKLTKTLGHSSQCLFTLLLYYLYGRVRDIEVDLCGGFYEDDGEKKMKKKAFCLSMGRILTSSEERMLQRGIKQLDRALGLFEFVWKTAGMKEVLELQGHLWCLGAEETSITYRGKTFILHDLSI